MTIDVNINYEIQQKLDKGDIKAGFYSGLNVETVNDSTEGTPLTIVLDKLGKINTNFTDLFKSANQNVTPLVNRNFQTETVRLFYFEFKMMHPVFKANIRYKGVTDEVKQVLQIPRNRYAVQIINTLNKVAAKEVLLGAADVYKVKDVFNNNSDKGIINNINTKKVIVAPTDKYNTFVSYVTEAADYVSMSTGTPVNELKIILFGDILKYVHLLQENTTKTINDYLNDNWSGRKAFIGKDVLGIDSNINGFVVIDPNSIFIYQLLDNQHARAAEENNDWVGISDFFASCNRPVIVAQGGAYYCQFKKPTQ